MNRLFITFVAVTFVVACGKPAPPASAPAPAPAAPEATPKTAEKAQDPVKPAGEAAKQAAHPPVAKPAAAPAERIDGWIAKVNGEVINAEAFYGDLDKITARGAKIPEDRLARIQQNILKRLVEKELIRQAVDKAGVTISDKEIDAAFAEYKKRFQTEEQFDNYLKHGRVTLDSIKARITEKKALDLVSAFESARLRAPLACTRRVKKPDRGVSRCRLGVRRDNRQ